MGKINSLGTTTYDSMTPAKLIIGEKEIDVMVKSVEQHIDEERNDFFEPVICNGIKKFAGSKEYVTRVYMCEERLTEYGNFL